MARTRTLAQLRSDARLYADQRSGTPTATFISDTELNGLINSKLCEHHELLTQARGDDYRVNQSVETTSPGDNTVVISSATPGTLSVVDVQVVWGDVDTGERERLPALSHLRDTIRYHGLGWGKGTPKAYRVAQDVIVLYPTPPSAVTVVVYYVPVFQDLANDVDVYDGVNGWDKLVTLGVAIEMRTIEERPIGGLDRLYQEQLQRIQGAIHQRQAADPIQIRDVRPEGLGTLSHRRRRWLWE